MANAMRPPVEPNIFPNICFTPFSCFSNVVNPARTSLRNGKESIIIALNVRPTSKAACTNPASFSPISAKTSELATSSSLNFPKFFEPSFFITSIIGLNTCSRTFAPSINGRSLSTMICQPLPIFSKVSPIPETDVPASGRYFLTTFTKKFDTTSTTFTSPSNTFPLPNAPSSPETFIILVCIVLNIFCIATFAGSKNF